MARAKTSPSARVLPPSSSIYGVGRLLLKDSTRANTPALSGTNLGGLTAGIAIMYVTALLVSV